MEIYYAGIGSRKSPNDVLEIMKKIGRICAKKDFILRSGGAEGADTAFETGCDLENGKKEIFLPWKGFNNNPSSFHTICDRAIEIGFQFHPNFFALSDGAQKLMARNSYQVLGKDCRTKSKFVVCYCPLDSNGNLTGGTSQAIRIATANKIPVFNLFNKEQLEELKNFIKILE